jgi:hypothetical protein
MEKKKKIGKKRSSRKNSDKGKIRPMQIGNKRQTREI